MARDFFKTIQDLLRTFVSRKGIIEFTPGNYEVFVHVKIKKYEDVWYDIEAYDYHTCGHVPKNEFIVDQKRDGFTINAKVESNIVKFYWYIR
jgi:hypothetical protein